MTYIYYFIKYGNILWTICICSFAIVHPQTKGLLICYKTFLMISFHPSVCWWMQYMLCIWAQDDFISPCQLDGLRAFLMSICLTNLLTLRGIKTIFYKHIDSIFTFWHGASLGWHNTYRWFAWKVILKGKGWARWHLFDNFFSNLDLLTSLCETYIIILYYVSWLHLIFQKLRQGYWVFQFAESHNCAWS